MLSQRSLKRSSFCFEFIFLFSVQLGWFPLLCLPNHWYVSLFHLICWFLLVFFFFNFRYFILQHCISIIYLFIFPNSVEILSIHPFFSSVHWAPLLSLAWTLIWVDCLPPLCLILSLRFSLAPSFVTHFSVSTFCLIFCLFVHIRYVSCIPWSWRSGLL